MTDERTKAIVHDAADEQSGFLIFRILGRVWNYGLEKPVLLGALLYGYVTLIGLLYNTVYFNQFGIDVVEFYQLQDFLLTGLRTRSILALPILFVACGLLYGVFVLAINRVENAVYRGWGKRISSLEASGQRLSWTQRIQAQFLKLRKKMQVTNFDAMTFVVPSLVILALAMSVALVFGLAIDARFDFDRPYYCVEPIDLVGSDGISPFIYIGATRDLFFFQSVWSEAVYILQRTEVLRLTNRLYGDFCVESQDAEDTGDQSDVVPELDETIDEQDSNEEPPGLEERLDIEETQESVPIQP